MIIHAKEETFEELVKDELVLVDFFANWCGPCKVLGPVLEQLTDVKIVKVDVDECENLASKLNVMGVPTLMIYRSGKLISRHTGFLPLDDLKKWISEN